MLKQDPINFNLKLCPSTHYVVVLLLVTLVSLLSILFTSFSFLCKLILAISALLYSFYLYTRMKQAFITIKLIDSSHNNWQIITPAAIYSAQLRGDSTLTYWLSVLRFKVSGKYWPLSYVIFKDAVEGDQYRKMLVIVRLMNGSCL